MIKKLEVKNFAIIEDITLEFNSGMTVLTGQTGAGKSLIIDTISLLLGARADTDMIRYEAKEARILGVFSNDSKLNDIFNNNNIPTLDDITVERTISQSKSTIKINGVSASLNLLKQIGAYLADLHIQNDTYSLFDKEKYLSLLDPVNDDKFNKLLNSYIEALYKYNTNLKDYETVLSSKNKTLERLEFLKYEHEELDKLDLKENLDKELEEEINMLENYDKISSNLSECYNLLNGDESSLDNIYDSAKLLGKISEYKEEFKEYNEKLMDSYYIIDEIRMNIAKELENLDFDEEEFNLKQERLNDINKAKEKYKMSLDELIKYNEKIALEIDIATNYDEVLKDKALLVSESYQALVDKGIKLSEYRRKLALELEKNITKECKDLDLENTIFKVSFNEAKFNDPFDNKGFLPSGIDDIDFLITFNKGEPLKPLYKVASGGEASRIMLAFKSYFSSKNNAKLMVFDEIDSGVSGVTALKIAKKMKDISKSIQVLAITHLASVAGIGDNHMFISKEEINGRTVTNVKLLSYDERVKEIATMINGDKISVYALEYAKELLNNK